MVVIPSERSESRDLHVTVERVTFARRHLTMPHHRVGSSSMPTRRILLGAACLAALPALSAAQLPTNQRLYDTTTSMPEVRASRLAKFESEPVVTGRVIFLGNSITQGGDWATLTGDSTVINRGIGAD